MMPNTHPFPEDREAAIRLAREWEARDPVFFDTETTGVGPQDVLVEIGVVDLHGHELYSSLIKPPFPIPPESTAVHKITNADVRDEPTFEQVWPAIQKVFKNRLVVAYNADFDVRLVQQSVLNAGLTWHAPWAEAVDLMVPYAMYYGQPGTRDKYKWQKLELAGKQCNIPLPNSHEAVDDAKLTAALLRHMAKIEAVQQSLF